MVKHMVEIHMEDEEEPEFRMTVLKSHRRALQRQISEAVQIQLCKSKYIMNSKSEWNGTRLPRVIVEVGGKADHQDYRGEGQGARRLEEKDGGAKKRGRTEATG